MDRSDEYDLYEEHADEAAFLWKLRGGAVSDAVYDLGDLCALDERVEAHLDGLRLAGDEGLTAAEESLDPETPGSGFVAMAVALDRGAMQTVARLLDIVSNEPAFASGIVSALGWASPRAAARVLAGLVFPKLSPGLHYLGVAGHAVNRRDPGKVMESAIDSPDARLRARALWALGELKRADLVDALGAHLKSDDEACRLAAAWSGALWRRPEALDTLWQLAHSGGEKARLACDMAARCAPVAEVNAQLDRLRPIHRDAALAGASALGDPRNVDWVLELLEDAAVARQAADVISVITGIRLADAQLETRPPDGHTGGPSDDPRDDDVAVDPFDSLPWPEPARLRNWWALNRDAYRPGERHFGGKLLSEPWLEEILRVGSQPRRYAAALELAIARPDEPPFEVRAPGRRQRALLA